MTQASIRAGRIPRTWRAKAAMTAAGITLAAGIAVPGVAQADIGGVGGGGGGFPGGTNLSGGGYGHDGQGQAAGHDNGKGNGGINNGRGLGF